MAEKLYSHDEDFSLDGSHSVEATPFDAHEQATRGPAEHPANEYPKAVGHVDKPGAPGQFEPIVVNSPEEEAAYHAQQNKEA